MKNFLYELGLGRVPKVGERVSVTARGFVEYGYVRAIQGRYCIVALDKDGSSIELYPSEINLI